MPTSAAARWPARCRARRGCRVRRRRCSARCSNSTAAPATADPRHVLARAVERLQARGLHAGRRGRARVLPAASATRTAGCVRPAGCCRALAAAASTPTDSAGSTTCRRCSTTCTPRPARIGLPVRTLMSEYAPGQFEITLEHRADALRAVDEAMLFKRAVRGVARRHGCIACFMAKPFAELAGTGMHLHASLADRAGPQRVRERRSGRHAVLRHAIGGLRATLADGMAVFAPHANSYRRFRAMSYAPVAADLGRQQPLGEPARAGRPAGEPPRRASRRGRRRESLPRRGAGARRHAARHRAAASIPGRRSTATATSRRRAATCRRTGTRRSSGPRASEFLARRARRASSSAYSSRSSGASARSSVRW